MQPLCTLQQRQINFRQYGVGRNPYDSPAIGGGDLQALAHDLLQRQEMIRITTPPTTTSSPSP